MNRYSKYSKNRYWIPCLSLSGLLSLGLGTGGCVSTRLQLTTDHPARADAPSAPGAEPAAILRADAPPYQAGGGPAADEAKHAHAHARTAPETSVHQHHQHQEHHEQEAQDAQTANVRVTSQGFEPSVLNLRTNIPARITFVREVERTCATEVIIRAYEIEQKLPLNEPVVVEFTPSRSGEFAFACGMDMFGGKIVVVER